MSKDPTRRQMEAMLSLARGGRFDDRIPELAGLHYKSKSSNMGGAVHRMQEAMGDAGWLAERTTRHGRTYYVSQLTAAGLAIVAARFPDEPGVAEKLAARVQVEEAEAVEKRARRAREREEASAAAARREADQVAHFRELMLSYQVRDAERLTDDQIASIVGAIVDKRFASL